MITKVTSLTPVTNNVQFGAEIKSKKNPGNYQNNTNLPGYRELGALKSNSNINFRGSKELSELEKSIIGQNEIRIPNLLDIDENIDLSFSKMPAESRKLNMAGLNIEKKQEDNLDVYEISNDLGNKIFIGKFDRSKELPTVTYKQGKFMPEITVKDSSLDGKAIKMLSGSILKGDGFDMKMPGKYQTNPKKAFKEISFTGNVVLTTLNKENRTTNAVDKYVNSGLQKETIEGDYADLVVQNQPTVIIPAGGFGERFKNITREKENKPSAKLPTDDAYRVIATALNMAAAAGILNGDENDNVVYISQKHEIPKNENTYWSNMYKTDGGAISEGLSRGIISNEKDGIILNADIFTNADLTRTYNALKTLPNAALVIPYYPVNPERAKSFGLLGIQQDDVGNMQIKTFVEKPKFTKQPPMPSEFTTPGEYDKEVAKWEEVQTACDPNDSDVYFANPGMYFLSSEALKVLMAQGLLEPDATGLGGNIMPKIVQMTNEGTLLGKDGSPLKAYTVPLEAKGGKPAVWDDIGTAEAYLKLIKDVASEVEQNGVGEDNKYYGIPEFVLNDFYNNVDLQRGIVFDSSQARVALDNFSEKYQVSDIKGNIFIA